MTVIKRWILKRHVPGIQLSSRVLRALSEQRTPALPRGSVPSHLFTRCKLNSIAESLDDKDGVRLSPALFIRPPYFSPAHCARYTSCVERSDKRKEMKAGRRGRSILKGTWQDSNNLLGSPSSVLLTPARFRPQVGHVVGPIYRCPSCSCAYVCVIESGRRGEKCQPASPELESGEIQAGKIRDWAIDLPFASVSAYRCLSLPFSLFPLAPFSLFLSLSCCVYANAL